MTMTVAETDADNEMRWKEMIYYQDHTQCKMLAEMLECDYYHSELSKKDKTDKVRVWLDEDK